MLAKRPYLAALLLVFLGLLFGATLVSGFGNWKGINLAFGASDPALGGPLPSLPNDATLQSLNTSYRALSKAVRPVIVAVEVKTEAPKQSKLDQMDPFKRFFGGDENNDGIERSPFQLPNQGPEEGLGSGVIITSDGYILTNNHVVKDAAKKGGVRVKLTDKRVFDAKVIGTDPTTDLAVIKIEASGLPVAALGNSDDLAVGDWVIAVGNPLGLESTVTRGIVSSLGRPINIFGAENYSISNFIQTDAAINPGNSGGGLFDMKGEVIGINTAIASSSGMFAGYGFAIPINMAKSVTMDLIKNGKVNRGYIGVTIRPIDQTDADAIGLSNPHGVLVDKVQPNSAGEAAGLKSNDVIISVDGHETDEPNQLQSLIGVHHAGDQVSVKIWRDGKEMDKIVKLKPRADLAQTASSDQSDESASAPSTENSSKTTATLDNIGVSVRNLTSAEQEKYGTKQGVYITKVQQASEAWDRGLGAKMSVVTQVAHMPIRNSSDFEKAINANKGKAVGMTVLDEKGDLHFISIRIPND